MDLSGLRADKIRLFERSRIRGLPISLDATIYAKRFQNQMHPTIIATCRTEIIYVYIIYVYVLLLLCFYVVILCGDLTF